ncbi:hypothetical protein EHQ23_16895 [Leptospira bourretii]|uniref:Uncharacterized protein n=1 Tax=Leptospira bourretii TaxID=2484962 RepID=A0A4R9IN18_9LEPT|nr:hypothetical protein [Leptospira bourretii]TGK79287.1 hypothetical protein EHQ23_16895 [Leptospira bourretii]TGK92469.1 hypothetical protein EHQ26_08685 [Leptospira bourretii]TGL39555.1 hypothetical protein EHQ45_04150 [Leptospira bourretii]
MELTIPILISIAAVLVAFWQGFLAKSSLEQAKATKSETERVLIEIKEKVLRIETISDETRKDVKEQITRLIDKQDENFKVLLNAPKENNQNEMIMTLLPKLMENPEMMSMLMGMAKKKK